MSSLLSVTVNTRKLFVLYLSLTSLNNFRSLSSSSINVSADASNLKLSILDNDIINIAPKNTNTSAGYLSIYLS